MSVGLLDFFVLEASDYVDRLQRLAASDEPQGPDSATLLKLARGLRGSATMARLTTFADAVSGLERGAGLLHEGRIAWTPALGVSITESIAELRALIPMARLWGDGQDQRARSAAGRMAAVLDAAERHGEMMQSGAGAGPAPAATPLSPNRAVAAFFDTIDQHAAASAPAPLPATSSPVLPMPVVMRLNESAATSAPVAGVAAMSDAHMPVVPIASLAPTGGADAMVFRAPAPSITFAQRFIADATPLVGSLQSRLAPLRQGTMQRVGSDMAAAFRPVLLSLRDLAVSYGHDDIGGFCDAALGAPAPLPTAAVSALDMALTVMLQPEVAPHLRAQRLIELRRDILAATPLRGAAHDIDLRSSGNQRTRTPLATPLVGTRTATPRPAPSVARPTPAAPRGRELNTLLTSSLEKVRELDVTPLGLLAIPGNAVPPASVTSAPAPDVVPMESLLYRGPRALSRARHIVGQLRSSGEHGDTSLLAELFDLVELAGSSH